jgi:hypothetical protein
MLVALPAQIVPAVTIAVLAVLGAQCIAIPAYPVKHKIKKLRSTAQY